MGIRNCKNFLGKIFVYFMLVIRLQRMGKKNQPLYRIVLAEKTAPPKGKYIEKLGFYDPKQKRSILQKERILYWLEKGAKPSTTIWNFLIKKEIIRGKKIKIEGSFGAKIKKKKTESKEQKTAEKEKKAASK